MWHVDTCICNHYFYCCYAYLRGFFSFISAISRFIILCQCINICFNVRIYCVNNLPRLLNIWNLCTNLDMFCNNLYFVHRFDLSLFHFRCTNISSSVQFHSHTSRNNELKVPILPMKTVSHFRLYANYLQEYKMEKIEYYNMFSRQV